MMNENDALLIHYLTEQGNSWDEIERIIEEVRQCDSRTIRDAIFDSIGTGLFDPGADFEEATESTLS